MTQSTTLPHILLIGSTGRTGRLALVEALDRNHTVTALARDPTSLDTLINEQVTATQRSLVHTVRGDATPEHDIKAALKETFDHAQEKQIVIVSTLGQTRKSGNPWSAATSPPMFMTKAAEALVAAIASLPADRKAKIDRLIVMSMFGAGTSFDNLHCLLKPVMNHSNMLQTVEDHNGVDAVVRAQREVKWVMVRPSMLKEGQKMPVKVHGEDGTGEGWMPSSITIPSVVEFMLDTVASREWDGKTPVICN